MTAALDERCEARVALDGRWLVVHFGTPHRTVSWAIVRGGRVDANAVAWHQVDDSELRPPVDARAMLRSRLASRGLDGAVGLLTSRRLDTFVDRTRVHGLHAARCIATVGLGNAMRVGDEPGVAGRIGTINLVCQVSDALT